MSWTNLCLCVASLYMRDAPEQYRILSCLLRCTYQSSVMCVFGGGGSILFVFSWHIYSCFNTSSIFKTTRSINYPTMRCLVRSNFWTSIATNISNIVPADDPFFSRPTIETCRLPHGIMNLFHHLDDDRSFSHARETLIRCFRVRSKRAYLILTKI